MPNFAEQNFFCVPLASHGMMYMSKSFYFVLVVSELSRRGFERNFNSCGHFN